MRRRLNLPRFDGGEFGCGIDDDPRFQELIRLLHFEYRGRRKFVLIDKRVAGAFPLIVDTLQSDKSTLIPIVATENSKSLATAEDVIEQILRTCPSKDDLIVNVGGGVVMNLGGFVAGILLRGMQFIHVPTTLTGQIDVCLGGKQAVNFLGHKNQLGMYQDPSYCYINTVFLSAFTSQQLKIQLVEGLKLCLTRSAVDFWKVYDDLDERSVQDTDWLVGLIVRLLALKAPLVQSDPFERHDALCLLYGHTVGHAIESASGSRVSHCEAVSLGMIVASRISLHLELCPQSLVTVHRDLSVKLGIHPHLPGWLEPGTLMHHLKHDKKRYGGQIRFVLTRGVGELARSGEDYFHVVPEPVILKSIQEAY